MRVKPLRRKGKAMPHHLNKVIDALHGGIAKYDPTIDQFVFQYCSANLIQLFCGRTDAEGFRRTTHDDALELVCESERAQLERSLRAAMARGAEWSAYFRVKGDATPLNWCQLDSWDSDDGYFVLFSGMSPEILLFQGIVGETADNVYIINRENYHLLYANDLNEHDSREPQSAGETCYQLLYGKSAPCEFCTMNRQSASDPTKETVYEHNGRFFAARFRDSDWNGIPAHIKYVRDVTDEVVSRRERERLEQYFQTVVKYLPGGMAVVRHGPDGSILPEYLSDGFAEMLGMTREAAWEMYQDSALSGVHPDDRKSVQETISNCIQKKIEKFESQYRLRTGSGGYIWVNAKFSVIQEDRGVTRVYVNYHDITAEKNMQAQLRQQYQEQIHQHYLLAGPDALILGHCNITQNKIYEIVDHTDSGLLEAFGDVREEFFTGIGTLIPDLNEREAFYSKYLNEPSLRAYRAGVNEVLMPCFLKLPNQRSGKYVQFKVILVETPDTGDITGILTVTDITEKMIREKIFLRLSSTNYDLVSDIDLFSDTYEIVSGGDDNISETRGSYSERIRVIVEETLIQSQREKAYVSDMLDPALMLERLRKEGGYAFTYSVYNAAGEIRTKNMVISPIDLRLGRVCFIRTDVTDILIAERKAKEDLSRALAEAEKANRVKSDFLSSMSHDIRTPMNAIVGMTALALTNLNNTEKIEDYLHKISLSSQHLLSLINDVLDMSQIEQSQIHLNHQAIQIEALVNHISSIMMSQAERAGLQLKIETEARPRVSFLGDPLRIKQILINLLSNALKFTPDGGTVWLRAKELPPREAAHVRYRFTVQDTGIGIREEFMNHLFEPFIRSDRVAKMEGTGLGLSITKGLVKLMGGEIRVSSKLEQGTTFEVELEFEETEDAGELQSSQDSEVMAEGDLSGYHFLLVEDNEINSEILGEVLQMWGATFTLKSDGLQAVHAFQASAPGTYDAIFMDVQMPVMNGYDAARAIRRLDHPDAKSIIILAMTANAFAEDVQAALDAGMDGHVSKPVEMKLLYHTISTMLKKREHCPPAGRNTQKCPKNL